MCKHGIEDLLEIEIGGVNIMAIQGPVGTGDRFTNAVQKLVNKGKTLLQARRIVASAGIEKDLRRKKKKKKRG